MATSKRKPNSIFVGNIPYDTTEEELCQIFSQVGPVVSFQVILDKDTGRSKGRGFCTYADEATARSALRNLQSIEIRGRKLRIDSHGSGGGGSGSAHGGGGGKRGMALLTDSLANISTMEMFDIMKQMQVCFALHWVDAYF